MRKGSDEEGRDLVCKYRIAAKCQRKRIQLTWCTDVGQSFARFCLEAELFLYEAATVVSATTLYFRWGLTNSAAVWELSDACDMLLVRGFADAVVDCKSAMAKVGGARCAQ